jgi:hypothetical protein
VNAEFDWWLLIVGLVVGGGLVWFVVADSRRRESDVDARERPREALWLSSVLERDGYRVDAVVAERMLVLHQAYLAAVPPDPDPGQDPLLSTGSVPTVDPSADTSDTPNRASAGSSAIADDGPTQ